MRILPSAHQLACSLCSCKSASRAFSSIFRESKQLQSGKHTGQAAQDRAAWTFNTWSNESVQGSSSPGFAGIKIPIRPEDRVHLQQRSCDQTSKNNRKYREILLAHNTTSNFGNENQHQQTVTAARPPLLDPVSNALQQTAFAYSSPTVYDPHEDYEIPSEASLLVKSSSKSTTLSPRAHAAIVIDGDNLWFRRDLLSAGFAGGRQAALAATKHVQENFPEDVTKGSIVDVRGYVICNLTDLERTLSEQGGVPIEVFRRFIRGWQNGGGAWFRFVDAGQGSQVADSNVRAHLVDSVLDQDCMHVFLGGLEDLGYANELAGLRKLGMLNKVSLLQLPEYLLKSKVYEEYAERVQRWPDVLASQTEYDWPEGGNIRASDKLRKPCIEHHLLGQCSRGSRCKSSHAELPQSELDRLRKVAKRQPCPWIARGEVCDYGADCPYGH
ncbi:hypothetical protein K437DRAFT_294022 [Tilletiaria anomala UBC 951]|uniref:C3H1-type domain-containing protein n=1 Tax=Tilletiaria anomala (strain ATCC 24038 / CBS 436.72 / UBC 951) TaxID=1037660 RepID=A0A066WAD3_TILAU|nr:uncharacterized protein K437DRAFT_294022 [Tilletiaria anomala UBC 951]KDN47735.1 hypothetical protein K437DRAFT_294022 [Tilletiaria anomala UBC 951]